MRAIQAKTDNVGDTLAAGAFNANLRSELQNVVTQTGQTLDAEIGPDTGGLNMLGKAIAQYSSDAGFYADSGVADAYVLGRVGSLQPVPAYFDGQQIVFIAGNNNTGASTVNVTTLGSKDIRSIGGAVLGADTIVSGAYIICRYNSGAGYFELVNAIATVAQQQAGTSLYSLVTPGRQQHHPSAANAVVNFNGTGVVAIRKAFNVGSITDHGPGDYEITFVSPMPDVNYSVIGTSTVSVGAVTVVAENRINPTKTVNSVRISVYDILGIPTDTDTVMVQIMGM